MVVRISFIYILIIILVSFGAIGGCGNYNEECAPFFCVGSSDDAPPIEIPDDLVGVPGEPTKCGIDERECGEECVSFDVTCCSSINGDLLHACPLDQSICCVDGTCVSNFELCPDVIECIENFPQPCGPICIVENATCCNEGRNIESLSCAEFVPICCPEGSSRKCAATIEDCN